MEENLYVVGISDVSYRGCGSVQRAVARIHWGLASTDIFLDLADRGGLAIVDFNRRVSQRSAVVDLFR